MEAASQGWPGILIALGALFVTIGGGIKWIVTRVDAQQKSSSDAEAKARSDLSDRLHAEIRELRVQLQETRDRHNAERLVYQKRIYQLEAAIHMQPGMSIPTMEGWPP